MQAIIRWHTPWASHRFPPGDLNTLEHQRKDMDHLGLSEIELGVLAGQCLDRRLPDRETLEQEVTAWVADRNAAIKTIDWRFTTDDARIKLDTPLPCVSRLTSH